MIKDCLTRFGNQYSLLKRGDDPDIIAVDIARGNAFLIDTETIVPLCYALDPTDLVYSDLDPICSSTVDPMYLESLVTAEEILIAELTFGA